MVQILNKKFLKRRRRAIKSVIQACLPEFLNKVFLRMLGLLTFETPTEMIKYDPAGVDEIPTTSVPAVSTKRKTPTLTENIMAEAAADTTSTTRTTTESRKKKRHKKKHR